MCNLLICFPILSCSFHSSVSLILRTQITHHHHPPFMIFNPFLSLSLSLSLFFFYSDPH
ncbi:hypothetical protein Patl1_28217 [Pistacia atlantica]|uniref:Uncharacterized protein n=1 Tax=Pistacia atlantica TaxID=434234 RepID=A0ACC1BHE9_9ROSI|nr:hypothetical protein Patl1_28217 [Pistacia atlantica]